MDDGRVDPLGPYGVSAPQWQLWRRISDPDNRQSLHALRNWTKETIYLSKGKWVQQTVVRFLGEITPYGMQ
jgi:hypothetical protein